MTLKVWVLLATLMAPLGGWAGEPLEVPKTDDDLTSATVLEDCVGIDHVAENLPLFLACLQRAWTNRDLSFEQAVHYFKAFQLPPGTLPFSSMDQNQREDFLASDSIPQDLLLHDLPSSWRARIRESFSDSDLLELDLIAERCQAEDRKTEIEIRSALMPWIELIRARADAHPKNGKELLLIALLESDSNDASGEKTFATLQSLFQLSPRVPQKSELSLLHPYLLKKLLPTYSYDWAADSYSKSDFYLLLFSALHDHFLDAPSKSDKTRYQAFRTMRDRALLTSVPVHPAAKPDAVRLAVIDSGIDFVAVPALAKILESGTSEDVRSSDYGDGMASPWVDSSVNILFNHGTGVSETVLHVLEEIAPEQLKDSRFQMAMWKVSCQRMLLRSALVFSLDLGQSSWCTRANPVLDALFERIENTGHLAQPKIVSMSLNFESQTLVQDELHPERQDLLRRAPWLWVMAAGNDTKNINLHAEAGACFSDLPREIGPKEKTLCVGALNRPWVSKQVAAYSNYGSQVDVYTDESFVPRCPDGTSCATPAIAAVAVAIADHYPKLSPQEIKQAIIEAADVVTLEVENQSDLTSDPRDLERLGPRILRYFDPYTMTGRALRLAPIIHERLRKSFESRGESGSLLQAARSRDYSALYQGVQAGHPLNSRNRDQQTPLMIAVWQNDPLMVQLLVKSGADLNAVDVSHSTAAMAAATLGSSRMFTALKKAGADLTISNDDGRTALDIAREHGL